MTVSELIEELKKFSPESLVVMSKDAEGSNFSPYADATNGMEYLPSCTWAGELVPTRLTNELRKHGFTKDDIDTSGKAVPCVCLWPVN